MHVAGVCEAKHHGGGADGVDHVVDIEAIARALLVADASECTVERVAEPVEGETSDGREEPAAVAGGERVTRAGGELGGEAEGGEMVGVDGAGHALGQPYEGALFGRGEKTAVNAGGILEGGDGTGLTAFRVRLGYQSCA